MQTSSRKALPAAGKFLLAALWAAAILVAHAPDRAVSQQIVVVEPESEEAQSDANGGQGPRSLPPAYDSQMLRLAEILGSLHYLRDLCGADEGQLWRDQMQELLDKEEPSEERRMQLTGRFNRAFRDFQEVYRECTPAAAEAANRYLRQGSRLAAEIPGRYGN